MQADGPLPARVLGLKPAKNQIADHGWQFVQRFALGGHFRLMADGDKPTLVPLDLKDELIFHGSSFAHETNFDKRQANVARTHVEMKLWYRLASGPAVVHAKNETVWPR